MNGANTTSYARWMREATETWAHATGHFANGLLEMNRAFLSVYGVDESRPPSGRRGAGGPPAGTDVDDALERQSKTASDLAGETIPDWLVEREFAEPNTVTVGDTVRFSKRLEDADVFAFARASGDTNPLHLDEEFASETRFERRIVHGTLVSGLISAALARLSGLSIYVSQNVRFLRPVDIGQRVTAVVTVEEDLDDERYRLSTDVVDGENAVIEGEAVVLVDPSPERESGSP